MTNSVQPGSLLCVIILVNKEYSAQNDVITVIKAKGEWASQYWSLMEMQ